ncbi:DNA mismatch repair protein MutT, partial [Vibrio parahaemolyticus]
MQKQRVSALLVHRENAEILLIKRVKDSRIYWVFPGGGVEFRELLTQA